MTSYAITKNNFQRKIDRVTNYLNVSDEIYELTDVKNAVEIIKNKFNKNEIYFDYKIYDISNNEYFKDCCQKIKSHINQNRLQIIAFGECDAIGIHYNDETVITQMTIFGNNQNGIIKLINWCFTKWKNDKISIENKMLRILIDDNDVKKFKKVKFLYQNTGSVLVLQRNHIWSKEKFHS